MPSSPSSCRIQKSLGIREGRALQQAHKGRAVSAGVDSEPGMLQGQSLAGRKDDPEGT